jgi:hypothetical protein
MLVWEALKAVPMPGSATVATVRFRFATTATSMSVPSTRGVWAGAAAVAAGRAGEAPGDAATAMPPPPGYEPAKGPGPRITQPG